MVLFISEKNVFHFGSNGLLSGCRKLAHSVRAEFHHTSGNNQTDKKVSVPQSGSLPPLGHKRIILVLLSFTVPAILYAINNNLAVYIQLEMDPATYQVNFS